MSQKIFLCREHRQVGDELIHKATLDSEKAHRWVADMRRQTGTRNFDVVVCVDNRKREDI